MARQSTVSFEQVVSKIHSIEGGGGKATNSAVREALGTGSMGTIGRHIRNYKAGQTRKASIIDDTIDPAISRAISNQIAEKVREATATITANLADLQNEYDAVLTEIERLDADLEFAETTHASLVTEYAALSGRAEQLQADIAQLTAELVSERAQAEAARVELAKALLRLEAVPKVESEIENIRAELKSIRTQAAYDLAQAAAHAANLHEAASVAIAKLEGEVTLRNALAENLAIVSQQRNAAIEAAKKSAAEASELRGQFLAKKIAPAKKPAMV